MFDLHPFDHLSTVSKEKSNPKESKTNAKASYCNCNAND